MKIHETQIPTFDSLGAFQASFDQSQWTPQNLVAASVMSHERRSRDVLGQELHESQGIVILGTKTNLPRYAHILPGFLKPTSEVVFRSDAGQAIRSAMLYAGPEIAFTEAPHQLLEPVSFTPHEAWMCGRILLNFMQRGEIQDVDDFVERYVIDENMYLKASIAKEVAEKLQRTFGSFTNVNSVFRAALKVPFITALYGGKSFREAYGLRKVTGQSVRTIHSRLPVEYVTGYIRTSLVDILQIQNTLDLEPETRKYV